MLPCRPQPGAAGLPPEAAVQDDNRRDWVGPEAAVAISFVIREKDVAFCCELPRGRAEVLFSVVAIMSSAGEEHFQ
jgi:hypothetical protein